MKLNIGNNIREQRLRANMSQSELADSLNVNYRTISSWETNRTEPKESDIQRMAKIFGCNESELTGIRSVDYEVSISSTDKVILEMYHKLESEQQNKVLLYMLKMLQRDGDDNS